jgi:hypothetical protein
VGRAIVHRPRHVSAAMVRKALIAMQRDAPAPQPRQPPVRVPRRSPARPPPELILRNAPARLASAIDPSFPVFGTPTTASVRGNFAAARDEIEELQDGKLSLTGGTMSGPIVLAATQRIDGGTF